MLRKHCFRVAGLGFYVALPESLDAERLLPSFSHFACGIAEASEDFLFGMAVTKEHPADDFSGSYTLVDEAENDMGHIRLYSGTSDGGYKVEVNYTADGAVHTMLCDASFSSARVCLHEEDPFVGQALCSLLRMAFSQAVLLHGGVSVHAAAVVSGGKAWLFMGKSGTGKSTHARAWINTFEGCTLLNDDNPVIRLDNGSLEVYGTPWSGKTRCYKNEHYPVGGIVRLSQSGENRFVERTDVDAFITLLQGCSYIHTDKRLSDSLYNTLSAAAGLVRVGTLECRPDRDAALVCAAALGR